MFFARKFMEKQMKITLVLAIPACLAPALVRTALLYRRLRFGYPFRKIPLTQGKYAIVDPQDYQRLSQYNWHAVIAPNTCYAARSQTCKLTGRTTKIPMHRSIIPIPDDMLCDHINHIGLDNRRINLRPATAAQNAWNRKKQSRPTSSKYKGVHKTISNTWSADITVLGKRIHLGSFKTETAAARAYDLAAKTHFGPFAYTNFKPVRFPILNLILIPIKALAQLLFLLCCIFITPLRKFQTLIYRTYPALITPFAFLILSFYFLLVFSAALQSPSESLLRRRLLHQKLQQNTSNLSDPYNSNIPANCKIRQNIIGRKKPGSRDNYKKFPKKWHNCSQLVSLSCAST